MRPLKLTAEQRRLIAERNLRYLRLRVEAAKHSPYQLAKELGVTERTIKAYLDRPISRAC